jgi:hypothetical protein
MTTQSDGKFPQWKLNLVETFELLINAEHDYPICGKPTPREARQLTKLCKLGLLERNGRVNEWRRTEKGDNFLGQLFKPDQRDIDDKLFDRIEKNARIRNSIGDSAPADQ